MGGTRFMVQWEEHPSHLATRLGQLLEHQTLVDVTLMCNTHTLRVHRAVLAACSPYFETILQRQLGMYPLIVLKDMQFSVLKSLIEFMYCGETSVTEDNLSALLQAAKFFQVKGLSAMTKEALGLTSTTPKPTTVNGDSARKAFVGRSKRVGVQQTFVASGLKTLTSTSHAAGSHVHGAAGDVYTPTTGKTIFQTTPKSVPVRQDTHHQQQQQQQQQQTDTAQLLLSLSGSEFPKQTFHTVSKNVRFHHGVAQGSAVTVEPSRSCPLDSSVVKNKDTAVRSEVIDRVPVVTPNGGVKPSSVMLPTQLAEKGTEQAAVPEKVVEATKDDVTTSQMFFVEDGPCKRGRPLKRQMNLVFQEKVLTDAEMALQKEAEASRKALEMLQQEMSTGDEAATASATQTTESVQQKSLPVKQQLSKAQTSQPLNNILTTTPRLMPKDPLPNTKLASAKTNIAPQVTTVSAPETNSQNVIYQVAGNAIPAIDSGNNETNIVYQLPEGVIPSQDSGSATNIVYQVADNAVVSGQDSNSQNIIYQVADNASTSAEGANNTNIIYQVTDNSNAGSGSVMSQYMEVLKEAGLPSDVPILLESADGSYVTVNEEVLMNIMNGGMIQVGDGSIVGGEGVQFIVQEVQEVNEAQVEAAVTSAEQTEMPVSADTVENTTDETPVQADDQMQVTEENSTVEEPKPVEPADETMKEGSPESEAKMKSEGLPSLEENDTEAVGMDLEASQEPTVSETTYQASEDQSEVTNESKTVDESTPMETDAMPQPSIEAPTHSDEVITGDSYGEEAMQGFAVLETPAAEEAQNEEYNQASGDDFVFPGKTTSSETEATSTPEDTKPKEHKIEEIPANGGMSVEQALQAMMGEGSDTEMEVCANTDADGTTKVKPIISHRETKGRSTPNEGSIDEETEDLRLVLSPEDESIKVEDESQSAEGSLNDSFTLALSSPDSTGNEKAHLEAEHMPEVAEGVQKPVTETEAVGAQEESNYNSADFSCSAPRSTNTLAGEVFPNESVSMGTSENSNSVEISESEASEPSKQILANEADTMDLEMDNSIPLTSDSGTVPETESLSVASDVAFLNKTEVSETENISEKVDTAKGLPSLLDSPYSTEQTDEVLPETNEDTSTSIEASDTNISRSSVLDSDYSSIQPASSNEIGKSLPIISLYDSNTSKEIEDKTDTFTALEMPDRQTTPSEAVELETELPVLQTEHKINSDNELPVTLENTDAYTSNTPASQPVDATEATMESLDSKLHTESTLKSPITELHIEDSKLRTESLKSPDTELHMEESKLLTESPDTELHMEESKLRTESPLKSPDAELHMEDSKLHIESPLKSPDTELSMETTQESTSELPVAESMELELAAIVEGRTSEGTATDEGNTEMQTKMSDPGTVEMDVNSEDVNKEGKDIESHEESEENGVKRVDFGERRDVMLGETRDDLEAMENKMNADENGLEASTDGGQGAVTSPSKDIPYAVGLLPLKTALEKLQAMPEYHPRKTRSASSGKEGGNDVPAGRLKRKASSTADCSEKKMKPSEVEDGEGSFESEGVMASEDFDESQTEGRSIDESSKHRLRSSTPPPPPQQPVDKVETLPSMMELVSDSSDAV